MGAALKYSFKKDMTYLVSGKETFLKTKKVNINKASLQELLILPQVGESLAKRIISYRETNGPFKDIEELKKIKGIGEKKLEALKDYISLD